MDQRVLDQNRESKARLFALLDRLSDADYARPLDAGWTVGAALAHLAFFDRRVARLVERIEAGDRSSALFELNVDITNDAMKPAWIGLTSAAVAAESRAAADEGDAAIEHLADDVVQFITEHGYIRVGRFKHRNEHIDEIEALLGSA